MLCKAFLAVELDNFNSFWAREACTTIALVATVRGDVSRIILCMSMRERVRARDMRDEGLWIGVCRATSQVRWDIRKDWAKRVRYAVYFCGPVYIYFLEKRQDCWQT